MNIEITKITAHSREVVISHNEEIVFRFKGTNHRDRFPQEMIDDLRRVINEMHDHNELMYIRDEERK